MTALVTVTMSGTMEELAGVWPAIQKALTESDVATIESSSKVDVLRFLGLLTDSGRRALGRLAIHAVDGHTLTRREWQESTTVEDSDEFNGVLGGIGRAWAKVSTMPNPFASLGTDDQGEHFHGIRDRELADELWRIITDRYSG